MSNKVISTTSIKYNIRYFYELLKNLRFIKFRVDYSSGAGAKNILVFSHEMTRTGAPLLLLHVVKGLKEKGYNVTLISQCAGPLLREFSNFSDVFICRTPSNFEKKLNRLIASGFGVALVNTVICGRWISLLKNKHIRVVSLVHEMPNVIKSWNAENEAKDIACLSDMVVFPSMFVKKKFEEFYCGNINFTILTQGIYLKPKSKLDKIKSYNNIIMKYDLENKNIILNVASGNYRKGFDLFLEMANKYGSYNFLWVGDYDKDIFNSFLYKNNLDEINNIKLLGYISSPDDLYELYSAASVLALTSREEPFGSIVLEALSSGTPVVGFKDAGGFQDVVVNGNTGYLVDYENIDQMISKINQITSDELTYRAFSNRAILSINNYSFERYIDKLIDLLSIRKLDVKK